MLTIPKLKYRLTHLANILKYLRTETKPSSYPNIHTSTEIKDIKYAIETYDHMVNNISNIKKRNKKSLPFLNAELNPNLNSK